MATASNQAKELLNDQEKKLSLLIPREIHRDFKTMAASQNSSMRDLWLEAYENYLVPKYMKEVQ